MPNQENLKKKKGNEWEKYWRESSKQLEGKGNFRPKKYKGKGLLPPNGTKCRFIHNNKYINDMAFML